MLDVGTKAPRNQKMPKAIGRVSRRRQAVTPSHSSAPRNITWTYFYQKEDTYQRIDYLLLSSGMAREWNKDETYVFAEPDWGAASDHRPILASFWAENR